MLLVSEEEDLVVEEAVEVAGEDSCWSLAAWRCDIQLELVYTIILLLCFDAVGIIQMERLSEDLRK
jgi:hypothetical protein